MMSRVIEQTNDELLTIKHEWNFKIFVELTHIIIVHCGGRIIISGKFETALVKALSDGCAFRGKTRIVAKLHRWTDERRLQIVPW